MAEIKQRIVSCPQGHYFDANAYSSCPLCGELAIGGTDGASRPQDVGSFSETVAPNQVGRVQGGGGRPVAVAASSGRDQMPSSSFDKTVAPANYRRPSEAPQYQPQAREGLVTQPVMNVRKGDFPHTVAIDSSTRPGQVTPVVGWFVAVSGPCRGTDYRIHTNYNYIGREEGDICVHGDPAISAVRDSSIAYVAKTNRFYIAHEQGLNTVLVNDEPVMGGSRELNANDIVTIGSTQFIFVPLCGTEFSWRDWPATGGE